MATPGLLNVITNYCQNNNIKLDLVNLVTKTFTGDGAVFLINELKNIFLNRSWTNCRTGYF